MNFSLTQTTSKTGYLKSKDQTPLFYRYYPLADHKASVFLVHGFGEHSGRYLHLFDRLTKDNYEVSMLDLRGHGYSEGRRGTVSSFANYEEDVIAGLDFAARNVKPNKKLFVLAHSMGALITLRVVTSARPPIDGMVLSCPLLRLTMPMPSWKKWASFAAASVLPTLRVSSGIKGHQLSRDQAIAAAYDADPLVLKNLPMHTFWEIFKSYQEASRLASIMSHSFFMQIGGLDSVVDARASEQWFKQVDRKAVDATLKIYPDLMHEIYNEADRHLPIEDAMAWLNARV
jgi:alpha-beta hydrolase superfamily lysophospholipase